MTRVLITGASGFVGAWLTRHLSTQNVQVIAQMRRQPGALFNDLGCAADRSVTLAIDADMGAVFTAHQPDHVVHLAGVSQIGLMLADPLLAYEANTRSSWMLFEALRASGRRVNTVIASTDSVYGETGSAAATEIFAATATGPYETSKLMAEQAARCLAGSFDYPITIARLGNVYGPMDANKARLVPSVIEAIKAGERPVLRGGGKAVRGMLYVDDCIDGLLKLVRSAHETDVRGQIFNLSGSPPMTTLQIARDTLDAFGQNEVMPRIIDDAIGETSVKVSSSEKLKSVLSWEAATGFSAGLACIVNSEKELSCG